MKQSRGYILTINNPKETDEEMKDIIIQENCMYAIFQKEKGLNGTEHYQVYIEYKNPRKFTTIKNKFPRAHIEPRKGTRSQAREYCSKEETRISGPYEIGEFKEEKPGKRNDILRCIELIENTGDVKDVRECYPDTYIKYMDRFIKYANELRIEEYKDKFRDIDVIYLYGKTGIGKTRTIMETYGYRNVYRVTDYDRPFDMYESQSVICFEEFRNSLKIEEMLIYLDGYPCQLTARYYNRIACYETVVIVSNWAIDKQYEKVREKYPETYKAFHRRIKCVINLESEEDIITLKNYILKPEVIFEELMIEGIPKALKKLEIM